MKYKIGDKVKIKKDLKPNHKYGDYYFSVNMTPFLGKKTKVKNIHDEYYSLDLTSGWGWTDEMLEPYTERRGRPKKKIELSFEIKEIEHKKKYFLKLGEYTIYAIKDMESGRMRITPADMLTMSDRFIFNNSKPEVIEAIGKLLQEASKL